MIDYLYGTDFEGATWNGRDFRTIYALIDSEQPMVPRYFGQTGVGDEYRIAKHISESLGHERSASSLKQRWLRGVLSLGRQPEIKVIYSSTNPKYDYLDMEAALIHRYWPYISNVQGRGSRIDDELYSEKGQQMWKFLELKLKKVGLALPEDLLLSSMSPKGRLHTPPKELDGKDWRLTKTYPGILTD